MENVQNTPDKKTSEQVKIPVVYSRFNPLIIKSLDNAPKSKPYFWYSILKFGSALVIGVLTLIALYFSNIWGAKTLPSIGIDADKIASSLGIVVPTIEGTSVLQVMGLFELSSISFSTAELNILITFGFITLFSIIPILLFKNGTAYSIGSLALSWIIFIIVLVIFGLGMSEQVQLVRNFESFNTLEVTTPEYIAAAKEFLNSLISNIAPLA